jgi:hypothetical protein
MASLFNEGYELKQSWEPVGTAEKMPKAFKEKVKSIKIRRTSYEGNPIVNAVVFFNNGEAPKSFKVSPYAEAFEYATGTEINPNSMELQKFKNEEGKEVVTCTCFEL